MKEDDCLSYLTERGIISRFVIIVSNDYDIKQIFVNYSLEPLTINLMTNEMYNKEKLFLPKNYQVFLNKLSRLPNDDIFNLNDNVEFLGLLDNFINKYEVHERSMESLIINFIPR